VTGNWDGNGIEIGTLDNHGWYLKISLNDTDLERRYFEAIDINRSEHDWMYCSVEEKVFKGFGGPLNLPEILQIFRILGRESEGAPLMRLQESMLEIFSLNYITTLLPTSQNLPEGFLFYHHIHGRRILPSSSHSVFATVRRRRYCGSVLDRYDGKL
jgi:hypothetical protein